MKRGDVRTAVLAFLVERPGYGYEIMQYLETKTNGMWRPSPGSIYPTLQQLEDEGMVDSEERDGRRVYALTTAGTRDAKAHLAEQGMPWDRAQEKFAAVEEIKRELTQLESATTEVLKLGDTERRDRAIELIRATRKSLYHLLAED